MMLPRNFEANRSTGPITAAGKQTVSRNPLVHGLAGRTHAALDGEEQAFAEHSREIVDALAPAGPIERELAESIAADQWRIRRARNMERALFAKIEREQSGEIPLAQAQAEAWIDAAKGLQRLALYANRIQRFLEKNIAKLEALQAARKAAYAQAEEEAILLTELAQSKGQPYDPAPDFPSTGRSGEFAYSPEIIAAKISKAARLTEGKSQLAKAA